MRGDRLGATEDESAETYYGSSPAKILTVLQARDRVELSSQVHSLWGAQHRVGYHFFHARQD